MGEIAISKYIEDSGSQSGESCDVGMKLEVIAKLKVFNICRYKKL